MSAGPTLRWDLFRVPSCLVYPESHFTPPRSLTLPLNLTVLPSNPAQTSLFPSSDITPPPDDLWTQNTSILPYSGCCFVTYLFTCLPPPLAHGMANRALWPTKLAQSRCSENTHDFELNWKLVGALKPLAVGTVQAEFLRQQFLFFFF